jgi:hypothetical protein
VKEIEDRVNRALGRDFAKRDHKSRRPQNNSSSKLFAFHRRPTDGAITYIGEVVEERGELLRIEAVDIIMLWAGLWQLSGSLYDVPRSECRLFNDLEACVNAVDRARNAEAITA